MGCLTRPGFSDRLPGPYGMQKEEWVQKCNQDFRAARALDPFDVPDVICFLGRQCAEKYLKAVLVTQGKNVPRIHNLVVLNDRVVEGDGRFEKLCGPVNVLNPFSVAVRYPGTEMTPDDAKAAFQATRALREQVRKLLYLPIEG